MLAQPKYVDTFLLLVPIAPDTLKDSGPIVEGVRHNAYLRFGQQDLFAAQEGIWF
jgi:hypothetical protein